MAIDWDRAIEIESGELQQTITVMDEETVNVSAGKVILYVHGDGGGGGGGGEAVWGSITGTLSNQVDLQTALNAKADTADLGDLASLDSIDYTSAYLTNKPTLGSLAGMSAIDYTSAYLTNKPTLGALASKNTADYATDVTNKPTLGTMSAVNDAPSDGKEYARKDGAWEEVTGGGGGTWGSITGTLSNQTDLQSALDAKTDLGVIAQEFSTSTSYAAGDFVIYDGKLYVFSSAHSAGAWTGADAYEVNVGGVLQAKQNTLTFDSAPTSASTNPVTSGGIYTAIHGRALHISMASTSSLGTISNASITTTMRVVNIVWGTPANVTSNVTWNTDTVGQLVLSGTLAGATTAEIDLIDFG